MINFRLNLCQLVIFWVFLDLYGRYLYMRASSFAGTSLAN